MERANNVCLLMRLDDRTSNEEDEENYMLELNKVSMDSVKLGFLPEK